MRRIPGVLCCMLVAACAGGDVLDASPAGIFVKEPFIGSGDPDAIAAEHCRQHGKEAVQDGILHYAEGYFTPIYAYSCR